MKEIGGYIEFEKYNRPMLHQEAVALNCGRNCLAYLIQAKKIKKIKIPYFLCDSVRNICKAESVQVTYYHIDGNFLPEDLLLDDDEWLYIVNYYGQLSREYIKGLADKYNRIIVDQAQAYFDMPIKGVDTLYTCRKFFGVTDGAFLYTDILLEEDLEIDISFERMHFLLGRYEKTASEFYGEYSANNRLFAKEQIKKMSKLTENLLHGIDYEYVKMKRTENFKFLHEKLEKMNKLQLHLVDGAFMYPFYHENATEIRKKLQQKNIYIPTLWPNVLEDIAENDLEYLYAKNILPLPCDQRYSVEDMQEMIDNILR